MATLALKMDSNPFFEYFMKLLAPSLQKRNKQALAILQNPMAYYACLGIKRSCSTYSQDIRNKKACESYEGHVVPAFFRDPTRELVAAVLHPYEDCLLYTSPSPRDS